MLLLLPLLLSQVQAPSQGVPTSPLARERTPFVENRGQWQHPAHFVARFGTTVAMLEEGGLRVAVEGHALRLAFAQACASTPVAEERLAGSYGYHVGDDAARWHEDVGLFGRVRYAEVWPGIDLVCHARAGFLEYDLELAPGSRLDVARFEVEGADGLHLEDDGTLVIETSGGPLRQPPPATWVVEPDGQRRAVTARFELVGGTGFGFVVDGWNGAQPLVVDPGLLYGTYYGSSGFNNIRGVALEPSGILTVTGYCDAGDLPTTVGALDTSYNGNTDAFVARFDPSLAGGQQLVYASFLGGNGTDLGEDVVVSSGGIVCVCGSTGSTNFPTTAGAHDRTFAGSLQDGFVACIDPARPLGQQLVYATLLGGSGDEILSEIMLDASERLVLAGWSDSLDYPTTLGVFDPQNDLPGGDGVLSILDPSKPTAQQLTYSTFFGGTASDAAMAAVMAPNGSVFLTGYTESTDFVTTPNAYDLDHNSPITMDCFVTQIDPSKIGAQQLVYSTYLGSNADDLGYSIAYDRGAVVVGGVVMGDNFPLTPQCFDSTFEEVEAFVSRLDPAHAPVNQLTYSTLYGGDGFDFAAAVAVDSAGVITVGGDAQSTDFYIPPGGYRTQPSSGDGFLIRLDPRFTLLRQLVYGTFVGGTTGFQDLTDIALDAHGSVTAVGLTTSDDLPVSPGAFDASFGLTADGFIGQYDMLPTGVTRYGDSSPGCKGELAIGVSSLPDVGNTRFSLTCTNATPSSFGTAAVGLRKLTTPFAFHGARLWIDGSGPLVLRQAVSNGDGACDLLWPIPNLPSLVGVRVYAQFFWLTPAAPAPCPPLGGSASAALEIRFQP